MVLEMKAENKNVKNYFFSIAVLMFFAMPQIVLAELVNINKAGESVLQKNLVGVGPVKAKAIVDYRKKNGPFKSIDDLVKVPGIGQSLIKNNRKSISTKKGMTRVSGVPTNKKRFFVDLCENKISNAIQA